MSVSVLLFFLVGLIVGSFITVLLFRLPRGEQVVQGRSRCPHCAHELLWYDSIPLVSYGILGGRCRYCTAKISVRYPLTILLTGMVFALSVFFVSSLWLALWLVVMAAVSIFIVLYDSATLVIPNGAAALFVGWALVGSILFWRDTIEVQLLGALGYTAFFLLLYLVSHGRWIGGGDVKLAAGIGLWLGWPAIITALMVTYVLGGSIGGVLLVSGKAERKTQLPFAPFLLVGAWVAYFFSPELTAWYLALL